MRVRTPLSGTEAAFVQIVLEEHDALVRLAEQKRDQRLQVLFDEKQIPKGATVAREQLPTDTALHLVYDDGKPELVE